MVCCTFIAALFGLILRPLLPKRPSPLTWRLMAAEAPALTSNHRAGLQSFRHAFAGLNFVARNEPNMRIHIAVSVTVFIFAWLLEIDAAEWRWLILAVGLVLGAEALNTAVEQACNAITREHNTAIKVAKDAAAGAVLISAATAALIGASVFAPHLVAHVEEDPASLISSVCGAGN